MPAPGAHGGGGSGDAPEDTGAVPEGLEAGQGRSPEVSSGLVTVRVRVRGQHRLSFCLAREASVTVVS